MLVGVLAPGSRGAEPSVRKIVFPTTVIVRGGLYRSLEDRYGHGRGMNPTLLFAWGNPLNSVSARFIFEAVNISRRYRHLRGSGDDLVLSALS